MVNAIISDNSMTVPSYGSASGGAVYIWDADGAPDITFSDGAT